MIIRLNDTDFISLKVKNNYIYVIRNKDNNIFDYGKSKMYQYGVRWNKLILKGRKSTIFNKINILPLNEDLKFKIRNASLKLI